jgi:NADPH:quinone reductase-like Zn-dependent oxidoreductase
VLVEGDDLATHAAEAIGDAPLELIIDGVAGEPVAQLAPLLKTGGQIVSYTARGRQPLSISILDLIFRGLSVHGYWLNLWLESTPRERVAQTYRELAALVTDGTLAAPVEATYALSDYREAIPTPPATTATARCSSLLDKPGTARPPKRCLTPVAAAAIGPHVPPKRSSLCIDESNDG